MAHCVSMAHLLYITIGLSGGLNSSLELARRARTFGHDVTFLGHRDLAEQIEAHGFEYVQICDDERAMTTLRHSLDERGMLRSLGLARRLRNELVASDEIVRAVQTVDPDALIIDVEAHYAIIATRALGLPTLTKSDFFSMRHQRGVPPLHSPMSKPRSVQHKAKAEVEWAKARLHRIATKTVGELHPRRLSRRWAPFRYNTVTRRDLKAVAAANRVDLGQLSSQRGWLWPHTYPSLPLVSATPGELDFVDKPAANDRWLGALIPPTRPELINREQVLEWERFRDHNRERNRPLLYCSFGTILPDTTSMMQVVLSVAKRRNDWDLVVGLGARPDPALHDQVDDNVLLMQFAPQLDVLAAADLAIIHGGINGILEAAAFGVPMVVEQSGPGDGPGNAARVEDAGLGTRLGIVATGADALAEEIDAMLNDQALRFRVEKVKQRLDAYEHDGVLENTLNDLVNGTLG